MGRGGLGTGPEAGVLQSQAMELGDSGKVPVTFDDITLYLLQEELGAGSGSFDSASDRNYGAISPAL